MTQDTLTEPYTASPRPLTSLEFLTKKASKKTSCQSLKAYLGVSNREQGYILHTDYIGVIVPYSLLTISKKVLNPKRPISFCMPTVSALLNFRDKSGGALFVPFWVDGGFRGYLAIGIIAGLRRMPNEDLNSLGIIPL